MSNDNLEAIADNVRAIADDAVRDVAQGVMDDLRLYARRHQRTGELARNIRLMVKNKAKPGQSATYLVDGSERSSYSNKSYHALVYLAPRRIPDGARTLTKVLQDARQRLK
jgi:hypothetical protein|nr:MAG TPA: putative tail-component [Caudoviricetes sp.]